MSTKNINDQHSFAFFYPETTQRGAGVPVGGICTIDDRVLCHRIMHVLRLNKGESFTLFDSHKHMECVLEAVNERSVQARVRAYECNVMYAPHIALILPMLKKEAFEESIYALTELGVNEIHLVYTKKTQRMWGGQKEQERVERIMQAAAEQSKNFAFPKVIGPFSLEKIVADTHRDALKIFFDPKGCALNDAITSINTSMSNNIVLMVGPEGDLMGDEKAYLNGNGFVFCQLTPTILRAQQAVTVSVGALRSLLHF